MRFNQLKRALSILLAIVLVCTAAVPSVAAEASAPPFPNIIVMSGETAMETGLNFGGKTFTYAHFGETVSEEFQAQIDAFEELYNVNIEVVGVGTQNYANQVRGTIENALLRGEKCPYDIISLNSLYFDTDIVTFSIAKPLNNYLTTADLETLSVEAMQQFSVHGNIYGAGGNREQPLNVLYYNKSLVKSDPLALYNNGTWTWEALYDILKASQDTENNVWGINTLVPYYATPVAASYGVQLIATDENGNLFYNRNDPKLEAALAMLNTLTNGDTKVADPQTFHEYETGLDFFKNKKLVSVVSTSYSYDTLKGELGDDLGVLPLPTPGGVTAVSEFKAFGASYATDDDGARCAVAFAKFMSQNYNSFTQNKTMTEADKALLTAALDNGTLFTPSRGIGQNGGLTDSGLLNNVIAQVVKKGVALTTFLDSSEATANGIITDALTSRYDFAFDFEPVLLGLEVIPKKRVYSKTESATKNDVTVNLLYADGTRESVSDYTISLNKAEQTVTVISGEYKTTYAVTIAEKNGWHLSSGKWYFYENGNMVKNAWRKDSKGWVFLGPDGAMKTNAWCTDSQGWCYVGADGYAVTNCWKRDSIGWIWLNANGSMTKNAWVQDGGKWYFLDANGYMVSNAWRKDSKGWVYLGSSGAMLTNAWCTDSKGWCYVGADGYAVTNCWKKDTVGWIWLDTNGSMVKKMWLCDGGKWYYLDANGYMVTGTRVIDGKAYTFGANGVWNGK